MSIDKKWLSILLLLFIITMNLDAKYKDNIQKTETDLRILTWNIYMLPHFNWFHGNCARARIIADKLLDSHYNVLVLEEAFDYRARKIIKEVLKGKYPYIYGPANNSNFSMKTSSGIWILSCIPLKKIKEIEYKSRFGFDALARKGAVMYEGNWNGSEFQLIGTHLQANSPDSIRREQCNEIAVSLLKPYSRANVMQIVCGDFNIEKEDTLNYNYMLNALEAENGKMDGSLDISFDELDNDLARKVNGKQQLIDYVLVRNSAILHLIKRKVRVFREYLDNKCIELSDHYAIEATLRFVPVRGYSASLP